MSGIFGMFSLDGGEPRQSDLDAMAKVLETRGPDGTHCWRERHIALGHTLLATTPEALVEILPLTDPGSGCTITADCRLDNRDELISELGLDGIGRVTGDGELILRAYLRWGEECPAKLLGDFAFAIWDPRKKQLFCARDHMGMRQFIYHHQPGKLFACATEPGAVLAHPDVPQRIDEGRIADFLDGLEGIDLTSTFFEDILRLPPAHSLVATDHGVQLSRYWQLTAGEELKLDGDEAYAEAFLEVFTKAVRCRLRSAGPVGAMLSGGMDSGSVAAVAASLLAAEGRGPLHSFSAIGPDPVSCVETRTILLSAALPGLDARFINHGEMDAYREGLMDLPDSGEPFDFHMTLIRAIYLDAHRQGVKIMLDGVAGDITLTCGNRVARLMRNGNLLQAIREARAEERFWGPAWPGWRVFAQAAWAAWVPYSLRKLRRRILDRFSRRRTDGAELLSPSLAKKTGLAARRTMYSSYSETGCVWDVAKRIQAIMHPHLVAARGRFDRVASAVAIEPRDPFMDIRLIEFCLSLPSEQLQSGGWPKRVLRRAMFGILPEQVIWRRGKEHLGWAFTLSLFDGWAGWADDLKRERPLLKPYVRPDVIGGSNQPHGKELDMEESFKLFFLLSWLRRSSSRPPVATPTSGNEHAEENA